MIEGINQFLTKNHLFLVRSLFVRSLGSNESFVKSFDISHCCRIFFTQKVVTGQPYVFS